MDLWIYIYIYVWIYIYMVLEINFIYENYKVNFHWLYFRREENYILCYKRKITRTFLFFPRKIHSQTFQTCVLQYGMKRSSLKANFIRRTNLVHSSLDSLEKTVLLIVSRRCYLEFIFVYTHVSLRNAMFTCTKGRRITISSPFFSPPPTFLPSLSFLFPSQIQILFFVADMQMKRN